VIVAVFRRRLRDGKTFEDFKRAWEADRGFGLPARVFNAVSLDRIDEMIESTELRAMYRLATEHDLTSDPREVEIGSPESLLRDLLAVS
jgi:hypothetical protein